MRGFEEEKMREIKYRGMDANGVMRYGRLSQDKEESTLYYKDYSQRICWNDSNIPVSNKTLGQYTNHEDKNEKEIYEGDIILTITIPKWKNKVDYDTKPHTVFFNKKELRFEFIEFLPMMWRGFQSIEIIGNIHENSELIKERKK